jgi:hypothetical protein
VTSADELADAVQAGARGIMHSVHDAPIGERQVALRAAREIYYVPTLSILGVDDFVDLMRLHFVSERALRSLESPLFQLGARSMSDWIADVPGGADERGIHAHRLEDAFIEKGRVRAAGHTLDDHGRQVVGQIAVLEP